MSNCCLIPVLSSQAGSCLTIENWQQAGVSHGVYYLESLLSKPGIGVLKDFSDLRSYTAWPETIILNACLTTVTSGGDYVVRSPYDGSMIHISKRELLALIHHLQVDYVIWPTLITDDPPCRNSMLKFLVPGMNHLEDGASLFYCVGEVKLDEAQSLMHSQQLDFWFESDRPASDALQAKMYTCEGVFDLLAPHYQEDFLPLDETCDCFTCQGGYTRAYLHHLLQQVPLLAQRFLMMHNYTFYRCRLMSD